MFGMTESRSDPIRLPAGGGGPLSLFPPQGQPAAEQCPEGGDDDGSHQGIEPQFGHREGKALVQIQSAPDVGDDKENRNGNGEGSSLRNGADDSTPVASGDGATHKERGGDDDGGHDPQVAWLVGG